MEKTKNHTMKSVFLSAILILIMVITIFASPVKAEGEDSADTNNTTATTTDEKGSSGDTDKGSTDKPTVSTSGDPTKAYYETIYLTAEEKLHTMKLKISNYGYELYCDEFSGEVAVKNTATGQILFSNPYDVASSPSSQDVKTQLLSQIILMYADSTGNKDDMFSFKDAAAKNQVLVKNVINGIRVEYSLGDEEVRYLVPRMIKKENYEEKILANIPEEDTLAYKKFLENAYYILIDINDPNMSIREKKRNEVLYPISKKMAIYVFDTGASRRELRELEGYIKKYCPDYTYAELQEDHLITGYTAKEKAPPLFKMALEYYLDEDGMQVRLPANGIRFDEDEYQLHYVRILPFFGAGTTRNTENEVTSSGYTFIPDGSGALFDFGKLDGQAINITGKVYGTDFAYHEIGTIKQETMRFPVYGITQHYVGERASFTPAWIEEHLDPDTGVIVPAGWGEVVSHTPLTEDRGFLAIIEEGDSLATITTTHGGTLHKYNAVYTEFYPRPTDSFNLADSISIGDDTVWTITSKRKYTGSYRIRFIMLTDKAAAENNGVEDYYEVSYVGMAKAYRDYLEKQGVLTKLEKTDKDIPLYIESFGAMDTDSTFLTFPITVKTALTTFDNLKTMYEELSGKGINNINFRLKGFTNGGMRSQVPTKAEFEKVVGGDKGYSDFLKYAKEKGIGVYPDFDFSYSDYFTDKMFDGYNNKDHAVRSIDNRYVQKRLYYSKYQETFSAGLVAISPSVFDGFYEGVSKDLNKLGASGISVSTLGSDLNSDFDKKEPYNREDNKEIVKDLLEKIKGDYSNVMVDAGNAYTLKYVNHILNVGLDSSHFTNSSATVPFVGMVLHGYVNFAGTPTNMASDMNYEILKMIENGSLPYFTLSYQNTPLLKEDYDLSSYYSVAYDIWVEDLIETYNTLNGLLKDVQDSRIVNHEFLAGQRVLSEDEKEAAEEEARLAQEAAEAEAAKLKEKLEREAKLKARQNGASKAEIEAAAANIEPTLPTKADNNSTDINIVNDGTIVRVTYENGITFILNYNRFAVTVEGHTIDALGYVKVN